MGTPYPPAKVVKDAPRSGFDYIQNQIAALIDRFHLDASRAQILESYGDICSQSLAFPRDSRSPLHSHINSDGTPFQYAVTVGHSPHMLQFLSEAGRPEMTGAERILENRNCITIVAQHLRTLEMLPSVTHLLDTLAPPTDKDLLSDHGGAYWTGVAFPTENEPRLRIYINARWGKEQDQWERLGRFAAYFDKSRQWQDIAAMLAPTLVPLGIAITLHGDTFPSGRIYLSAYGRSMPFYEELAYQYGSENFMRQIQLFGRCMLGDDYSYPTQTAVCSFGFGENKIPDFKFELCAHCLFANDIEATDRLGRWYDLAHLDAFDYWEMLDILSEGYLSNKANDLHCYVGLGYQQGMPYGTIYLKPRLITV